MNGVEIPEYFLCPISLQIMQDPVTTVTGITYDRATIETWLITAAAGICPVTNQPLQPDSLLTPNHTLRRLIKSWCTVNAVDHIPSPQAPITKSHVAKLLRPINSSSDHPDFLVNLTKLEAIATSPSSSNKKCLVESNVATAMVNLLIKLCVEDETLIGVKETLRILQVLTGSTIPVRPEVVDSITWLLTVTDDVTVRTHAIIVMRKLSEVSSSILMDRLHTGFFKAIVGTITSPLSNKATSSALRVLTTASQWARNRMMMITEAGLVHALIELELELNATTKKVTELTMGLLARLIGCADGRERLLGHGAGVAVVAKRLLRVSSVVDEAAVVILAAVAKYSGTAEVVGEMMKVGAVAKLCMVLQADCEKGLKDKASEVLRLHYGVWNNKDCVQMYLISGYPTLQF